MKKLNLISFFSLLTILSFSSHAVSTESLNEQVKDFLDPQNTLIFTFDVWTDNSRLLAASDQIAVQLFENQEMFDYNMLSITKTVKNELRTMNIQNREEFINLALKISYLETEINNYRIRHNDCGEITYAPFSTAFNKAYEVIVGHERCKFLNSNSSSELRELSEKLGFIMSSKKFDSISLKQLNQKVLELIK